MSEVNPKSGRKVAGNSLGEVLQSRAKTHKSFWSQDGKLFKEDSPDFSCRIQFQGRRERFQLETPNKEPAAAKAAEIYRYLTGHGWTATLAKYKPDERPKLDVLTVGAFLAAVRNVVDVSPLTLAGYERSLRTLVAGAVLHRRFKKTERQDWQEKVEAVRLDRLTPDAVQRWKVERKRTAHADPLAEARIKHTANSVLRNAKALFSGKKVIAHLPADVKALLPDPLPLSAVTVFSEDTSAKFTPDVDPEKLVLMARTELAAVRREDETPVEYEAREQAWLAFLLCFMGGLRRKEADLLIWQQVDFDRGVIELSLSHYLKPKTKASAMPIPLEPEVLAILRGFRARHPSDEFVLRSARAPKLTVRNSDTRCEATWKLLQAWLRAKGVTDRKPIHSLRKAVGSVMARRHGIHAAQRLLRHTTPVITSRYYADAAAYETPGLGALLSGNVKQGDFQKPKLAATA